MKKIGYIYRYNENEGKGILVYGYNRNAQNIQTKPLLFSKGQCLSPVYTGQLVYFELEDNFSVSQIERASLANFKRDILCNIVSCYDSKELNECHKETTIQYENLEDINLRGKLRREISMPEKPIPNSIAELFELFEAIFRLRKKIEQPNNDKAEEKVPESVDVLFALFEKNYILHKRAEPLNIGNIENKLPKTLNQLETLFVSRYWASRKDSRNLKTQYETINELPNNIEELYALFGNQDHRTYFLNFDTDDTCSIDILDIAHWLDIDIAKSNNLYGRTAEQVIDIFELFIQKRRNALIKSSWKVDDSISPNWRYILSNLSTEDLKNVLYKAPMLQPALPVDFCKKNIDILTNDYGMPNVEICKLYCLNKISKTEKFSDYKYIKHKLYVYRHCNAIHLEGEGTPMCKMGKIRIRNLEKKLEEQYEKVIKQNVKAQLLQICEDANVMENLNNATPDDFKRVAIFIENCDNLRSDFLGHEVCDKVLDSYEELPKTYQVALKNSLLNCINESAICVTQSDDLTPFILRYHIEKFDNWILESTKQRIKELVNDRFSKLGDLEDLSEAYKADYITSQQYCSKYEQITRDFNTYQFLKELSDYKLNDSPIELQWYVVSNIINQLGYEGLNSYKYVKIDYQDSICDIRSLLKWLASYGHLNETVLKKAEEKICSVLSKDERWTLFEEKVIQSPGTENIRERLDNIYKNRIFYKHIAKIESFKHSCFQDVMLSDLEVATDHELELFIADNLDSEHQILMQQKATGFMKLYLWQKRPTNNYDWNLIRSHYHELSAEAQIKLLRYIFGKMSSGDFSISFDDLYSEFVETTTPACPAICGILCILKAKMNNLNSSITPSFIESLIGGEEKQRIDFLKDSKELFYPCHGYLAISGNKHDIEYQSFNGILTKENKNEELFYVIKFYDSPVDLFGKTIDWLDHEEVEIAEQVLLRNSSVDIINGKYYIHVSNEFFVKQFVIAYNIDDKCGLVSDKERMIEMGWLPRNNAYQPLYTNYIRKYEDSDNYICRGGCFGSSDPKNNGIPFFWCNKKMCVRRAHFLLPPSKWEDYRFADLLFIVLGQSPDVRESVWKINGEVSRFICDYQKVLKSNERNIYSKPIEEFEERGIWEETSSIYRDIYDGEDDEYENDDNEGHSFEHEEPTYARYNGSYAQDEMGYSDDDIDTIFDGDPRAYWNLD